MDIRTNSWIFQDSITTAGNGEPFITGRNNQLIIFITGTSSSRAVWFEGSDAESTPNWYSIPAVKLPELTVVSSTTGNNEVYAIDLAPWYSVRCRISAVSGGTVKVTGRIVESGTSLIGSTVTSLSGSNLKGANVAVVTTAGTRVQLPDLACNKVTVIAKRVNTGYIYVGKNTVSSSVYGADLAALDSMDFEVNNLNELWIDASVSGEGISYVAI